MKKHEIFLLTLLATFAIALSLSVFSACHSHEYGEWDTIKAATCTENGEKQRKCSCGEKEIEAIEALEHDVVTHSAQAATCEGIGWQAYDTCTRCDYTTYEEIAALTHDVVAHSAQAATCEEIGWQAYDTCSRCDYTTFKEVAATGHSLGDWVQVSAPTCENEGEEKIECINCDHFETKEVAMLNHQSGFCSNCGKTDLQLTLADGTYYIITRAGDFKGGELIIPQTYNNKPIKQIAADAFYNCDSLTNIVIPEGVTSIGSRAFYSCIRLESVTLPTTLLSIDNGAFYGCTKLQKVHISSIESWCNIDFHYNWSNPFALAGNLYLNGELITDLVIPEGVERITGAFEGCTSIKSVTIPKSLESISGSAFRYCSNLQSVYISDLTAWCNVSISGSYSNPLASGANLYLNGQLVTDLNIPEGVSKIADYAFCGCGSIKTVTMPNSVEEIGKSAFRECLNLTDFTIGSGVTKVGEGAFSSSEKLKNIVVPNSVISVGDYVINNTQFYDDQLEQGAVYFGNHIIAVNKNFEGEFNIKEGTVSIAEYAFNAVKITNIIIPDSIKEIGKSAFYGCTCLKTVKIGSGLTEIAESVFVACYNLNSVTLGENLTTIGSAAFGSCYSLTNITIPKKVTSINSNAFGGCYNLFEVTNLSQLDIQLGSQENGDVGKYAKRIYKSEGEQSYIYITEDGYKFYDDGTNCYLLDYVGDQTNLVLPESFNNKPYGINEYAFAGSRLKNVVIPDGVTAIGNYQFRECYSLISVSIGNSVTSIGTTIFYLCDKLESVTIGDGVTAIGEVMFASCYSLKSVNIGAGVTTIAGNAFYACINLKNITVSENNTAFKSIDGSLYSKDGTVLVKYAIAKTDTSFAIPNGVIKINNSAFGDCENLTSITIPNSVTEIGSSAFSGCVNLKTVTMSNAVTTIGEKAFYYCKNLTQITFDDTTAKWKAKEKGKNWDYNTGNYTVVCANGTLDKNGNVI